MLDEQGESTAAAIERCRYLHQDVTDEAGWHDVVRNGVAPHGPLDVLINNAGILLVQPMLRASLEDHRCVIEVNQAGAFL